MSRVSKATRMVWPRVMMIVLALVVVSGLTACGGVGGSGPVQAPDGSGGQATSRLTGAGATFPYPLYSKWFDVYEQETGIRVNYQSIGSGGGIRQLIEKTVDFGASDAIMTEEQLAQAGGNVVHIPAAMGAVVTTYNVQGIEQGLKLSPGPSRASFSGRSRSGMTRRSRPTIRT